MRDLAAKVVYVDPEVRQRPNCRARLDRVLPHVQCDDVRPYDDDARQRVAGIGKRRHGKDDFGDDAVVVFTTFDPAMTGWYYHLRDAGREQQNHGGFCQTALELNVVDGCMFRCAYCGFGRTVTFHLDVERLVAGLDDVFGSRPRQTLYKYSNMTDLPPFEPELDAVAPMVRRFAEEPGRYLMLFTKSDDVDFLLTLDHRGRTIVSWSLTCETASRLIDRRAAPLGRRIEAMRVCQAAGYRVRARLSPIVPVRNWRGQYEALFDEMFAKARPDIVTLELLGWFDFEDLTQLIDTDLLDPEALGAAREAAETLRGVHWGPFPEAVHQEIYRFCIEAVRKRSPDTPVAVCHGTKTTWEALGKLMGMSPEDYVCNCGPTSAPGNPLYDRGNRQVG